MTGKVQIVFYVVIAYFVLSVIVYFYIDSVVFQPPAPSYEDSDEIIKLQTSDNKKISALFLETKGAKKTILYSHGNAEDIGSVRTWLKELQSSGYNVLAYDYHGYGTSEGTPSESNAYKDIQAAYDYLVNEKEIKPENIILYGASVGSAMSIDLATKNKVGRLVLQSPFISALQVVKPYSLFLFDKYNNLKKISKVSAPILIIHGVKDKVIPVSHGNKLFDAIDGEKELLLIPDAGHNDIYDIGKEEILNKLNEYKG